MTFTITLQRTKRRFLPWHYEVCVGDGLRPKSLSFGSCNTEVVAMGAISGAVDQYISERAERKARTETGDAE